MCTEAEKSAEAADQFSPLMSSSKYEDGKALYHECCYKGGLAAIEAKDYKKAITLLNAVKMILNMVMQMQRLMKRSICMFWDINQDRIRIPRLI